MFIEKILWRCKMKETAHEEFRVPDWETVTWFCQYDRFNYLTIRMGGVWFALWPLISNVKRVKKGHMNFCIPNLYGAYLIRSIDTVECIHTFLSFAYFYHCNVAQLLMSRDSDRQWDRKDESRTLMIKEFVSKHPTSTIHQAKELYSPCLVYALSRFHPVAWKLFELKLRAKERQWLENLTQEFFPLNPEILDETFKYVKMLMALWGLR